MKTPIPYPGRKATLAKDIIPFFSPHRHYVEPFAGSAAVLFAKTPAHRETLNDKDGRLVNLYRVIKKPRLLKELVEEVGATAYSESELGRAYAYAGDDPVTMAWATVVVCNLSIAAERRSTPHFRVLNSSSSHDRLPQRWSRVPEVLTAAAERLDSVQITCRDAVRVIKSNATKGTLIYADPPYLLSTRKQVYYREEMSEADHERLLEALLAHPGPAVLSGYESDLYSDALEPAGWRASKLRAFTQGRGEREEILWFNDASWEGSPASKRGFVGTLFGEPVNP